MESISIDVLLDTNILIALGDQDERLPELRDFRLLSVSSLSWAELTRGLYSSGDVFRYRLRKTHIERLGAQFGEGIPFGDECIAAYEQVMATVSQLGRTTRAHVVDRMIAATALAHGLAIVTRDRSGFAGLEHLIPIIER